MYSAYGSSSRDNYVDPPSVFDYLNGARRTLQNKLPFGRSPITRSRARSVSSRPQSFSALRLFSTRNLVILFWILLLWIGERRSFRSNVDSCEWSRWEKWHPDAQPHRTAFLADPQLVDPHTYPSRPWPLSALTFLHTDLYLKRAFRRIQTSLYPDSTIFLGDLFDGGREWHSNVSNEGAPWARYKEVYWKQEYRRFQRIFSDNFRESAENLNEHRRMITSLPGNHDLGFGRGINLAVRERFETFFGQGNRIDILGNHSIVSVDSVSLSALGQVDPETGEQGRGLGDASNSASEKIWRPSLDFIQAARDEKAKLGAATLGKMFDSDGGNGYSHSIHKPNETVESQIASPPPLNTSLPTILLTHVPLYRAPNTNCGPLREAKHGLLIERGFQYQNVLTESISHDLVEQIGDIAVVFSGDDHDYCDLVHSSYTGAIREITVKSMSWAMGVRRPGFVLASLWNPVEADGSPYNGLSQQRTIQTHLCLLPDQLAIFLRYILALFVTVAILFLSNVMIYRPTALTFLPVPGRLHRRTPSYSSSHPLLPTTSAHHPALSPIPEAENERTPVHSNHPSFDMLTQAKNPLNRSYDQHSSSSSTNSSISSAEQFTIPSRSSSMRQHGRNTSLSSRPNHNVRRSPSPGSGSVRGGYGLPSSQISADAEALALSTKLGTAGMSGNGSGRAVAEAYVDEEKDRYDEWGMPVRSGRGSWREVVKWTMWDCRWVGCFASVWYLFLFWGDW